MSELVTLDRSGPVATITLSRPQKRNALDRQMTDELRQAVEGLVGGDGLRAVVLTHMGPVFCAGWDVVAPRDAERDAADLADILAGIMTCPVPVVAQLRGGARGAGMALVAGCDVVVAAAGSQFAFSEVRVGVVPALVSYPVLHRTTRGAVAELMLTGRTFSAEEARDRGLVTRIAPDGRVDALVTEVVDGLVAAAPGAVAGTKELLLGVPDAEVRVELDRLAALSAARFASPEAVEGMRAFSERREPVWPRPGGHGG